MFFIGSGFATLALKPFEFLKHQRIFEKCHFNFYQYGPLSHIKVSPLSLVSLLPFSCSIRAVYFLRGTCTADLPLILPSPLFSLWYSPQFLSSSEICKGRDFIGELQGISHLA